VRVLITGGTGFIGQALCPRLAASGWEVVVLSRQEKPRLPPRAARSVTSLDGLEPGDFHAVINLAGAPIGDVRWSAARRRLLVDSRVETTSRLVQWMAKSERRPEVLLSASAVGFYGEQGDAVVTEETAAAPGFTHDLCEAWEAEARKAEALGVRVCIVRTGIVLDRGGGALARMLAPFLIGIGGRLGSGTHWFPWLHREDMVAIYLWLLQTGSARGVYNASAPEPVTNAQFTRALASVLHRPALLPLPAFVLRLGFGAMAPEMILVSDRMVPRRLLDEGFRFRFPRLDAALAAMFR
jgi:uncharacterized protein (TIGR01777 family)